MQRQQHRTLQNQFIQILVNAAMTLRSRDLGLRKKQAALKTLSSRIRIIWPAHQGTMVLNRHGARGKAAKKALRKASHIPGYYGMVRRGEI